MKPTGVPRWNVAASPELDKKFVDGFSKLLRFVDKRVDRKSVPSRPDLWAARLYDLVVLSTYLGLKENDAADVHFALYCVFSKMIRAPTPILKGVVVRVFYAFLTPDARKAVDRFYRGVEREHWGVSFDVSEFEKILQGMF